MKPNDEHGPYCEQCGECLKCYHEECLFSEDGQHSVDSSGQDWRSLLTDDERQLLADIQAADSPLGGSQLVKRLASLLDEITATKKGE